MSSIKEKTTNQAVVSYHIFDLDAINRIFFYVNIRTASCYLPFVQNVDESMHVVCICFCLTNIRSLKLPTHYFIGQNVYNVRLVVTSLFYVFVANKQ